MSAVDLDRFHDGYRRDYDQALNEVDGGRKRSHWMWFIFPQVTGLGSSPTAAYYAIRDGLKPKRSSGTRSSGPATARSSTPSASRSPAATSRPTLFGRPDDQKLVSSLTLFAGLASGLGDDWAPTVAGVEVLDRAETQGLPGARRPNGSSPPMLDPDTAPVGELDRELARLQRQYRSASHEVGERGVRPGGIDDATLAWWVAAHHARWRRRFERGEMVAITEPVEQVELRKSRLRRPPR